jgi:hypothetical protein
MKSTMNRTGKKQRDSYNFLWEELPSRKCENQGYSGDIAKEQEKETGKKIKKKKSNLKEK